MTIEKGFGIINPQLKAFIGLSSPLAFNEDETDKGDPNPVLEGPTCLCLFYQELWFLDKSLCPLNMRNLPYVKFVNKAQLPSIKLEAEHISFPDERVKGISEFLNNSDEFKIGRLTQYGPEVPPYGRIACPTEGMNRVIDEKIASALGYDLVINSFSPDYANLKIPPQIKSSKGSLASLVTNAFFCEMLNLQFPEGPYLEKIGDLRNHIFKVEFKDKVKQFDEAQPPTSVREAAKELVSEFDNWNEKAQYAGLDPERVYRTGVDLIVASIPIIGNIYTVVQAGWKMWQFGKQRKYGWAVFLAKCLRQFRP